MSDSRPTTYAELAKRPSDYREVELLPAAASPLNSVAMAERMYRRYAVATPVSGNRTAIMHLREFQRTAQMMVEAHEATATFTADASAFIDACDAARAALKEASAAAGALYRAKYGSAQ